MNAMHFIFDELHRLVWRTVGLSIVGWDRRPCRAFCGERWLPDLKPGPSRPLETMGL